MCEGDGVEVADGKRIDRCWRTSLGIKNSNPPRQRWGPSTKSGKGTNTVTVLLLHLTDIHIASERDAILGKSENIAAALNSSVPTAELIVIVVSGDIAFSGKAEEYAAAEKMLKSLISSLQAEARCPVKIVLSPGNHDCDFSLGDASRNNNIAAIAKQNSSIDPSVIESCISVQREFFEFRKRMEEGNNASDDGLWRTVEFVVGNKKLQFDLLNVSWVSKMKEDKNLVFPIGSYTGKEQTNADFRLVVLHHPMNWYSPVIYRPFRKFVRKIASLVITGHEHEGNVGLIDEQESKESAYIEGCVLQKSRTDLGGTGFFLVAIDLAAEKFSATKYSYLKGQYVAEDKDAWSEFRKLPVATNGKLKFSSQFMKELNDPGAPFKHAGSPLVLGDIFVFPDMRDMRSESRVRSYVDASTLVNHDELLGGLIIEADDKAGSTSLLYTLVQAYLDKGMVPILLHGEDIKRTTEVDLDTLISKAIRDQYEKGSITSVSQQSRGKKILLLDDFDASPIRHAHARARILSILFKKFDRAIVSANRGFEIQEIIEQDVSREIAEIRHFQLQPFGFSKQSELTQKWHSIGRDGSLPENEFIGRCDSAERLITSAMQKSLIPAAPLYLLTLLQSVENGRAAELKESALGHYYHYLLSEAFQNAKVHPSKLTEHFQYATHLAWEFHVKQTRELSHGELSDFNRNFTRDWTTVALEPMLATLLTAGILYRSGDDYSFRYPYMYYYLKGKYIAENLSREDIRQYLKRCCEHLYVRENANTVLFLAHHSNDEWLLDCISGVLGDLFKLYLPVTFDGDTDSIHRLISGASELTYKGGTPKEHRERTKKMQDEVEEDDDGLSDREEIAAELSLPAKITMLFKTTEILGQVLKNQYSTIRRPKKRELLSELFNGSMRALASFYRSFERDPVRLTNAVELAVEKSGKELSKEEIRSTATRIVAELVQALTVGLIVQPAKNSNSDDLLEDVRAVVGENKTLAFRLIELAIKLDSAKPIPRRDIDELYEANRADVVVSTVIKILVFNRLYMFKTTEPDMAWLSSKLRINLSTQHAISYQQSGKKLS